MAHATEVAATEPDRIVVPMGRGGFDASSRDPAMKALIDADPTHADVAGVPAQLLATTSALGPEPARPLRPDQPCRCSRCTAPAT